MSHYGPLQRGWTSVAFLPRVGAAFDLTGDGKTAIRFSYGIYNSPKMTGYLTAFNPTALSTDSRTWTDKDLAGRTLSTNGDGEIVAGTIAALSPGDIVHFRVENFEGGSDSTTQTLT